MILDKLMESRCHGCVNARFIPEADKIVCTGTKPAINDLERAENVIRSVREAQEGRSELVSEAIGYLKSAWHRFKSLESVGDAQCLDDNAECFEWPSK